MVDIFFPIGFLIRIVSSSVFCVMFKLDLFCYVIWVLIYILHCINLMIIETIQEVNAAAVHGSTL